MAINRWWDADGSEVYWLETTERDDIGVDLHAPQFNDQGVEHHAYSQINEIRPGDVVLHYDTGSSAIVGWSRASGEVFAAQTVWGSHGTSGRKRSAREYERPAGTCSYTGFTGCPPT